jgi:hypothetical protein
MLKDLALEDVLKFHPLINAQDLPFRTVQKTKPIKARPINTILDKSDQSVFEKMLLATLEGSQDLKRDSFICWGVDDDVWQQDKTKLDKQYDITDVDADGWLTCVPKPESPKNGCQVVELPNGVAFGPEGGFSIINPKWGDKRVIPASVLQAAGIKAEVDVTAYLHYGVKEDWILQAPSEAADVYRVALKFFRSTYDVGAETPVPVEADAATAANV